LYKQGDVIRLKVREDKTHIFDIETGDKIRA
jgi:multiple sugar transport system ATP-binding protein